MEREQLVGPYVTEDEGNTIILLPIQKRLRYLIPFGTVAEVIEELRSQAERLPGGLAIYADDGEKFGIWPDTHQHCYLDGWLGSFFEAVEQNSDWLQVVPLGQAAEVKPVGRAYLPSASYDEMLHWALPAHAFVEYEAFEKWLAEQGQKDRYSRFVRGGHWRGFLAKYDEANLMHKKMLWVSDQLSRLEKDQSGQTDELEQARDSLYASQCNCPYWHGVFGGLYLPHIRQAVFSRMIDAGNRIRQLAGETELSITELDYDSDGVPEVICDSELFTAVLKPDSGGMLLELSLNRHNFNLTDTMSRRREGYHDKLAGALSPDQEHSQASIHDRVVTKEEGLDKYIAEDWYLKRCLIDHFFSPGVALEIFGSGRYGEDGDFILEPYRVDIDVPARRVIMTRDGLLRRPDGVVPVRVIKQIVFTPGSEEIEIRYELSSRHPGGVEVDFAVENNFNFQAGHAADRYLMVDGRRATRNYLDAYGEHKQAGSIILADEYRSLAAAVSSNRSGDIWHLPIFTVSLSEGGFEKVYQGTTIVHRYRLSLSEYPQYVNLRLLAGDLETVLAGAFRKAAVGS
jgi:alpha-amylase